MNARIEYENSIQRFESDRMRLQTYYLVQYLSMGETKLSSATQMMPFEWDKLQELKPVLKLTEEDWIMFDNKYVKGHLN